MSKFSQFKTRQDLERMLTDAQMKPELKENYRGYTVYVGDGFSETPHVHFQKFGVEKDDFDHGAFCTMWLIGEGENIRFGSGMMFERFHDVWLSDEGRKQARIRKALQDAVRHVDMLEKAKKDNAGGLIHA